MHRVLYLEVTSGQSKRKSYAHRVEANQEIGIRMVNDAQTEIAAFVSQNSGGPLNVTKMLAAIEPPHQRQQKREGGVDSSIPICSVMKILVHMHSNPIIDVEINENFMSIKAL